MMRITAPGATLLALMLVAAFVTGVLIVQAQRPAPSEDIPIAEQAERAVERLQRGRIARPASYAELTEEQRSYVHGILSGPRSAIPPPLAVMLVSPQLGDLVQQAVAYARFAGTEGASSVPPKLNELAILMAARMWSGEYVWHAHHEYAVQVGLSREVVEAVRTGRRPAAMEPDVEAVYRFLDEMVSTRQVSEEALDAAREALGGDRGVIDLVGTFALYSISSMMVMVDQSPLPEGVEPYLRSP
jgi:4-carboxymuconolactone decarboxylase